MSQPLMFNDRGRPERSRPNDAPSGPPRGSASQSFQSYLSSDAASGRLVVQPRMGFGRIEDMRAGLLAVRDCGAEPRVATLTVDAYTRVGARERAAQALADGHDLNGYPITLWSADATRGLVDGLRPAGCVIQLRHGSAFPQAIFEAAAAAGLDATEGGPISYCLPYSRAPAAATAAAWEEAARFWGRRADEAGVPTHIESFGGCMFGQLCPPSMLIAISVLEALFFVACGVPSVSVSLAQGTCDDQDVGALLALDRIRERRLAGISSHIVAYTFMGVFPETEAGAERLVRNSARLAVMGGSHRLIVKTIAEAHGIPSVADNVRALRLARDSADAVAERPGPAALIWADLIEREAEALIEGTLALSPRIGDALVLALGSGLLDIPYSLHPDLRGAARAGLDPETGACIWTATGALPLPYPVASPEVVPDAAAFHDALQFNRRRYDGPAEDFSGLVGPV